MATITLPMGRVYSMVQNTIYALPPRVCRIYTSATTPTIQQSTDPAFGSNTAVTLSDGSAEIAGGFIRCTTGAIDVMLKPV